MKFGQQLTELVDPKFRNYCVAYNMLKGYLKGGDSKTVTNIQTIQDVTSASVAFLPATQGEELPTVLFQEALTKELEKVNTFCELEEDALMTELRYAVRSLRDIDRADPESSRELESIEKSLEGVSQALVSFGVFIRLNYTAFRKITKKEAKVHHTSSASWFMANVSRAPFMTVDFDRLITTLSICYELLRSPVTLLEAATPVARFSSPFNQTRVFAGWVSDETLLDVKVALAKAMTLDLNSRGVPPQALLEHLLGAKTPAEQTTLPSSSRMISEYFSPGFQVDHTDSSSVTICLPSGAKFMVSESFWRSLLTNPIGLGEELELLDPDWVDELMDLISAGYKSPLVRCEYSRYIFHTCDDDLGEIDVYLDEHAVFTENGSVVSDRLSSNFTGHVLYISMTNAVSELPEWLTDITGMAGVTEVPKFSKRVHGLTLVARESDQLPDWFVSHKAMKIVDPARPGSGRINLDWTSPTSPLLTSIGSSNPDSARNWFSDYSQYLSHVARGYWNALSGEVTVASVGPRLKDTMVKIEPKSFFACERNLLDWIHTGVVVSGVGWLIGRKHDTVNILGYLVALVAVFMLVWQVRLFRIRNRQMLEKEGTDFADRLGPVMLFACMILLAADTFMESSIMLVHRLAN